MCSQFEVSYDYFQATIDHRRLAVDLAEVIIKWEVQRIKEDQEQAGEVSINKLNLPMLRRLPCEPQVRKDF